MFQTDLNHYLQSFASDELTLIMKMITDLGYPGFLMILLIVLLFAVDFRKSFLLVLVLLWTAIFTLYLKHYFDLPRPFHVDNSLFFLDGSLPDDSEFMFHKRGDAEHFWSALPEDIVQVTRQSKDLENGFPSGHTSVAIALWGAIAILYRRRWVSFLCASVMVLIPISRIYLGVHFLADVLGGILVGICVLIVFYFIILKPEKLQGFLKKDKYVFDINALSFALLILPFCSLVLLPVKEYTLVAYLFGFGLSFLLLGIRGVPMSHGTVLQRFGRTLLAIGIFYLSRFLLKTLISYLNLAENISAIFLSNVVGALTLLWIGSLIGLKLKWFKRFNYS